ncbi:MAG: rhodanese-like domain-containing protein [Candidatus Poseidoniaceae archaeon]|nr:rhodanese-like domain-containing protein [Candidatus Poseidoniaceae archaeon]
MSGMRSRMAIEELKSAGIDPERLHNLKGGFKGWLRAGGPIKRV